MNLAEQVPDPFDGVKLVPGYADTYPNVRIGGLPQPAAWPSGVYAAPGEPVFIAQIVKADAPAQNVVVGRVGPDGPREGTVTTVPGGSDTITVTAAGADYTATFLAAYTPTVGDRVRLFWQGKDVTAIGKVGVTPAPAAPTGTTPSGTTPPPAPASSGTFPAPAVDSATYWSGGGWDSIRPYGGIVTQGTVYGTTNVVTGAWFYGTSMAELAGATIKRVRFRVPQRRTVGDYNSALTLHLYAHTSALRPGGDVTRVSGPTDVTIPAGWNPGPGDGFIDLPTTIAATLIAGGGISISGDPYLSFVGKPADPASGQLLIDWSR
ncbi:hypothetical protein [Pseudarthrobacter sp. NIBRBAC000502771]|uniref:hypothetical protein n=1 Tax=Pseudarthrobacter sp. NIBRBAC000502771 TaxID=2590774 RepID=UPI0011311547|nr:hypothetical protein [Pseudarthrobacter sp. NIBRBAC000502771]QDG61248.1 hypothetical protein NIBR502771_02275 [Pseudarthrobacter sp. NIBRBAC000502771]